MNLNPFDFSGFEFLGFYMVLIVGTAVACRVVRRQVLEPVEEARAADLAPGIATDPYQVAYLRGGRNELIRVAVVSLIERGMLNTEGDKLVLADKEAAAKTRRPLDKTILMAVAVDGNPQQLYANSLVAREADLHAAPLEQLGVLPDDDCRRKSCVLCVAGVSFLWLVAATKIAVAVARGHSNILFLIVLAVTCVPVLILATCARTTRLGQETCRSLRDLFSGLHGRRDGLRLSQTTSELTFLAAVFGIAALPNEVATLIKPLRLQPQGGDGSGSSCGGGCGGGCGGCS